MTHRRLCSSVTWSARGRVAVHSTVSQWKNVSGCGFWDGRGHVSRTETQQDDSIDDSRSKCERPTANDGHRDDDSCQATERRGVWTLQWSVTGFTTDTRRHIASEGESENSCMNAFRDYACVSKRARVQWLDDDSRHGRRHLCEISSDDNACDVGIASRLFRWQRPLCVAYAWYCGHDRREYRIRWRSWHDVSESSYRFVLIETCGWLLQLESQTGTTWSDRSKIALHRSRGATFQEFVIQTMMKIWFVEMIVVAQSFSYESWQLFETRHGKVSLMLEMCKRWINWENRQCPQDIDKIVNDCFIDITQLTWITLL